MKTNTISLAGTVREVFGAHAGIYIGYDRRIPFADRLQQIRDAGDAATCLWWPDVDGAWRKLRDGAPDQVRSQGLVLDNIHVPYDGCNALWSPDTGTRISVVERHLRWVDDCARHGIPRLVMHVTLGTKAPLNDDAGLESLRQIVEAAEDGSIVIAIENTRLPRHVEFLLERINSPALGLCFDTGHDRLYSRPPLELLHRWGHRLVTTHLSDNDGKRDRHWLPGDGVVDFDSIAALLAEHDYSGAFMIEAVINKTESAESFLNRGHAALRRMALNTASLPTSHST